MAAQLKIALAGNPNSGKTTLFNRLTGSNQFVGNWPGVTVEKKEGKLKTNKDVIITDLPGIYSLSPYSLEEVVARNYLLNEEPDAILNIIDGSNLERNLYLTTQLCELGIPVVAAINMMDIVSKNGDKINMEELSKYIGCEIVEISALKGTNVDEAAQKAVLAAQRKKSFKAVHKFSSECEQYLEKIAARLGDDIPEEKKRFYATKLFERDEKIAADMKSVPDVSDIIKEAQAVFDDDSESIIINERYEYISKIISKSYKKKNIENTSDKIDKILTNRWLALPIFAVAMFLVYYISVTTVGTWATDWVNDSLFGGGWHMFSIGASEYNEVSEEYTAAITAVDAFAGLNIDDENFDEETALSQLNDFTPTTEEVLYTVEDEGTLADSEIKVYYSQVPYNAGEDVNPMSYLEAVRYLSQNGFGEPDPADYGIWVPSIPIVLEKALDAADCANWLKGLILDGIVAGVGAVLGFLPQMLVLFIFLAFLEACGYMARIAFIMDRIFRKFGLSGKSFIPILIGTGCGVPGIMASRTIENVNDRRMTIITTTFIPCGAKLPFIAMVTGAIFGGAAWVAPSAYFLGIAAIICSGIILKKTKMFLGDTAPFVMELPAYHMPTFANVMKSMWERGWSFIKKAGTIILLSTIVVWFLSYFGFVDGAFTMLEEEQLDHSILAAVGNAIAWIFIPLGWGNWQSAVASVTGILAKENIVSTMGILYNTGEGSVYTNIASVFTSVSGFSFLAFNLLCAPCVAAIGAMKREMNSAKWTWFAIAYQCGFAYLVALVVNQIGGLFTGAGFGLFTIIAIAVVVLFLYMLLRPTKYTGTKQTRSVSI